MVVQLAPAELTQCQHDQVARTAIVTNRRFPVRRLQPRLAHALGQAGLFREDDLFQAGLGDVGQRSGRRPDVLLSQDVAHADGELLRARPADVLPLAQRYFLF